MFTLVIMGCNYQSVEHNKSIVPTLIDHSDSLMKEIIEMVLALDKAKHQSYAKTVTVDYEERYHLT